MAPIATYDGAGYVYANHLKFHLQWYPVGGFAPGRAGCVAHAPRAQILRIALAPGARFSVRRGAGRRGCGELHFSKLKLMWVTKLRQSDGKFASWARPCPLACWNHGTSVVHVFCDWFSSVTTHMQANDDRKHISWLQEVPEHRGLRLISSYPAVG